jgi:molybdate transport system substrate-binding protein
VTKGISFFSCCGRISVLLTIALFVLSGGFPGVFKAWAGEIIHVFAAASTTEALREVASKFEQETGKQIRLNLASSGTLARQIENGAPADLFISANIKWMDHLEKKGEILQETRWDIIANQLILIAPKWEGFSVSMEPGFGFSETFSGWLALGDPEYVPVGMYAREALQTLGWWSSVKDRVFPCKDAPATVNMALREEAGAAVVFATDIHRIEKVKKIAIFPPELHAPIIYPAALCKGCVKNAGEFLSYLRGKEALTVFSSYGFLPL